MKILLLILLIPLTALSQSDLIIRHINVIDVKTGNIKSNQYVSIHNCKIAAIHADNNSFKFSEKQIDGRGKYLIPGLWDMHAHYRENVPVTRIYKIPTMLANGVTGLRNMNGTQADLDLRDSVNKNLLLAPREIVASPLVNGPNSKFYNTISINDVGSIPALVDSLQKIGYDFIKVYSFLRSDLFYALAKYCKEKHMAIAGHVPFGVTVSEASDAGLQSIEHFTGFRKSFLSNANEFSAQLEKEFLKASDFSEYAKLLFKADPVAPFDTLKAKNIIEKLKLNHTAIVPTITVFRGWEYDCDSLMKMPSLAYVSKQRQEDWYKTRGAIPTEKGTVKNALQLLNFLHKQGMLIMAGTDVENPFVVDGFSLHDELEYYVEAGLTPLEALQTATLNPGIFLHKEEVLGTIDVGKFADLLILNDNPLIDISNTRKIDAVIMNGTLIDKTQIEQMLTALKEKTAK